MRIDRALAVGLVATLLSANASAAYEWVFRGVKLKAVESMRISTDAVRLTLDFTPYDENNPLPISAQGCDPTRLGGVVSNWGLSNMDDVLAVSLSAMAQDLAIDILVSTTECSDSANPMAEGVDENGDPLEGLGLRVRAVRLSSD